MHKYRLFRHEIKKLIKFMIGNLMAQYLTFILQKQAKNLQLPNFGT